MALSDRSEIFDWTKVNLNQSEQDQLYKWQISGHPIGSASISDWPELPNVIARLNPLCARELETFGGVAAEDDAVLEYFLKTPAVQEILDGKVLLVSGRKGSGKTALVRHFTEGSNRVNARAVSLGQYPWKLHERKSDPSVNDVESFIESWRYLIAMQVASFVLTSSNTDLVSQDALALSEFFLTNYGGFTPDLGDIVRPKKLELSKASFEPQVMGNKLGSVTFENENPQVGRELKAITNSIFEKVYSLASKAGIKNIYLHFDELDRGLVSLDKPRKNLLIGLVLASLDVSRSSVNQSMRCIPIVYLRTDLWDELKFSDKNKITQGKTLNLEWNATSLNDLVNERIKAALGTEASWGTISSPNLMRGSQSKWAHILARTFLRPRDVISYLNVALGIAKRRDAVSNEPLIIENRDTVEAREKYSSYLKKELEDEIGPHWLHWTDALKALSKLAQVTFKLEHFKTAYEQLKSSENLVDADDALKKLYEFSVIGYERRSGYGGSSWIFHYTHPDSGWDSNSTGFKVHAGLKEVAKLQEKRRSGLLVSESIIDIV
ncbi:hypothetical protein QN362_18820 [Actimicrobium sp. CCC2.4]|uniref:P-loop ATPase, Sll1717 family n=1 Tax=Actimicrobium sp. CCC2.4 TaxID=3048606 RepID=UPI002AC9AA46|nr:hypothetical protein [Actimicrobium sp. CCC2.4]MEB0137387.1 hypothetical protein [Actimicrobium sp. CCC2.4]WPX30900.1 hypothetical protein RHM62_11565 [Actimicrobium sp. CCC2.4]